MRSEIISTYALCGFANFSSLGIVIGGLCGYFAIVSPFDVMLPFMKSDHNCFLSQKASICPPRRGDISSMVLRAMITGTCVSLVNACIAGKRYFNESVASSYPPPPKTFKNNYYHPQQLNLFSIELLLQGILFLPPVDCVGLFAGSAFNTTNSDMMTCCADLFQK